MLKAEAKVTDQMPTDAASHIPRKAGNLFFIDVKYNNNNNTIPSLRLNSRRLPCVLKIQDIPSKHMRKPVKLLKATLHPLQLLQPGI